MAAMISKKCANEVCGKPFDGKNPKKRFCCPHCKNQAAYNYRMANYAWEVKMLKARNKNIQILEYLWNRKMVRIKEEELLKLGFDFIAGYMYTINEKGTIMFRYGNIGILLQSKTEVKLIEFKHDE